MMGQSGYNLYHLNTKKLDKYYYIKIFGEVTVAFKILNNTVLHNDSSVIVDELRLGDLNDQPTISDAVLIHDGAGNVTLQNVFFDAATIDVTSLTTDSIAEGTSNLYYTDARVIPVVNNIVDPQFAAATAADAVVLSTAQSYTDSVVSAGLGSLTTDDILEATNLYYTDTRVQSYLTTNSYATQAYADLAETSAINTANSYTDTRESAITTAYQAYADLAENDANSYTNAREAAITAAYQTYADQAETDAEAAAALDATAKANAAQTAAEATAAADATTKANAALASAQTYADQAEADAIATSNNYTNTQVTKTVIDGLDIEAASVQANSVALGTDTTGNYVATITGTTNEVEVTGSGTETASVTVGLPANVTVSNNLTVEGDLTVNGTTTTVLSSNTRINENLLYLNEGGESTITNAVGNGTQVTYTADNDYSVGYTVDITGVTPSSFNGIDLEVIASDSTSFTIASTNTDTYVSGGEAYGHAHVNVDLGWAGAYDDGTYAHAGVFRDATDGVFKVFEGYTPEPSAAVDINTSHASFLLADFEANNVIINGTPTSSNHATTKSYVDNAVSTGTDALDTDDVSEGTTNLYYTDARVDARIPTNVSTFTNDAGYITSFTNTTYSAGTGLDLTGTVFSIDNTVALKTELFSGDYGDLSNAPTDLVTEFMLDQHIGDSSVDGTVGNTIYHRILSAKTSAISDANDYTDTEISNLSIPTVPTNVSAFTNDSNYSTFTSNQATNTSSAVTFNRIVLSSTTDASASSTSHGLQVGTTAGQNIIVDTNEVMARNNGAVSALHLNADGGDVTINNNQTDKVTFSGGEITASGDITAYSDRALKRNIQTLENGLDKVMNMRGVTFLKDGKASLGVIAQEVETVIPEVVKQDQYGMRSVAYGNIVGVLIEAIKEQQEQIEKLQSEIANLKK